MFESLWRRAGRTVLIVSENPDAPGVNGEFLRQPDIRLLTSYPNDEGLEIARRERPNLIIEDLESPNGKGMEFYDQLRRDPATRGIPLILVARADAGLRALAKKAVAVLEKPLVRRELFRAVHKFLPMPHRRGRRLSTNLRFIFHVGDQVRQACSRDVSSTGVFLKTDRIPSLGTMIDLQFRLPGCWSEIRCRGLVRNTSTSDGHGHLGGIGVEFEELSEEHRDLLDTFIERQLHRQFI